MSAGDTTDTPEQELLAYEVEGDFVIGSSKSPDAWVSAAYPVDLTEVR